jgi:hypothetical protein
MGRASRVRTTPPKKAKPKATKQKVKVAMGINRILVTDGKINAK